MNEREGRIKQISGTPYPICVASDVVWLLNQITLLEHQLDQARPRHYDTIYSKCVCGAEYKYNHGDTTTGAEAFKAWLEYHPCHTEVVG